MEPYAVALRAFLDLNWQSLALSCVERIADAAVDGGGPAAARGVDALTQVALELETRFGEPAAARLQAAWGTMFATLIESDTRPAAHLSAVIQLAKGLRFAAALYGNPHTAHSVTAEQQKLLEEIQELEAILPRRGEPDPSAPDQDVLALTTYATRPQAREGAESQDQLANLRRMFDMELHRGLLDNATQPVILSTDEVRNALGNRTVLLNIYLARTSGHDVAAYTLALARESDAPEFYGSLSSEPSALEVYGDEEARFFASKFSIPVRTLLLELRAPADPDLVTPLAQELLGDHLGIISPRLQDRLAEWRAAGKDHLCIVPHGPCHFAPFHLFGKGGRTLADDWTVSYLPTLQLLVGGHGTPAPSRRPQLQMTALGITYSERDPYKLGSLDAVRGEVRAIAELYDTTPLLDDAVTESALTDALGDSLYVHIAAHGSLNAEAPSFQCLYLTPDGTSDGRLSAHELLRRDLRGTQVVTLSACETALGRFDYSDNLRGLPASFLLGGVSTIVGTLWPVEDAAAAMFFTAFYCGLRDGAARLEAFRNAQAATRERYPAYHSWGPFCYVGEWD